MEGSRLFVAVVLMFAAAMLPEVAARRYFVGGRYGWTTNVDYKDWAHGKHFYKWDWLVFVHKGHLMSTVLEVSRTDYKKCNWDHPLHNWTSGGGRDEVPLRRTKTYYFISGNGLCSKGMKLAVRVQNPPPPPAASFTGNTGSDPSLVSTFTGQAFVPDLSAVADMWDSFHLRL